MSHCPVAKMRETRTISTENEQANLLSPTFCGCHTPTIIFGTCVGKAMNWRKEEAEDAERISLDSNRTVYIAQPEAV
jgi:hypothetical protein